MSFFALMAKTLQPDANCLILTIGVLMKTNANSYYLKIFTKNSTLVNNKINK